MKKKIHYLLVFPLLSLLFSCSSEVYDKYYARPDNLADPIYQQLEAKGNFKNLVALIDKAGYKDILGKAGYWTMLAPNDDAFAKFFQEQGISDVSKVDNVTAAKIVRYALVYNAFRTEQMSDYQSASGWVVDNAFRRRTAYYDGFQNKTINGKAMVVVGSNRNNRVATGTPYYVSGDSNNKYISYFTGEYFKAKSLSSYDFNFFYPNAEYSGFNILDSKVTQADIVAENGIIHEVNKVNLPLINLDQYLETKPQYSLFRKILEDNLVSYVFNQDATNQYHNFSGKSDGVYVKVYDPGLSFSPNNENYLKVADNDGQSELYTMVVPENEALQQFMDQVLFKHFDYSTLPKYIFQDLINAHMVQSTVWPSKSTMATNALNENLRFDFNADIKDAKILSNGFFYGSNKVQKSNLFYSVYTSAYLNPSFSLATKLFNDGSGFKEMISNIYTKYTLFLPSDAVLTAMGYGYDPNHLSWTYTSLDGTTSASGSTAHARLLRILYNGIVPTPKGELNDLSGSGIIRSGDDLIPGEYIKWKNNRIFAAGNEAPIGGPVNILGYEDQQNGRVYYVDNLIQFSEEAQGFKIQRLSQVAGSQFTGFFNYLKNSLLYDPTTGKIDGLDAGVSCTIVVPNNAAITKAVRDGVLPASSTSSVQADKDMVSDFIRYHIIVNRTASDDGLTTGRFETLRKNSFGEKTYVEVLSTPGTLSFKDGLSPASTANYVPSLSNNLADRSLIHLVDNYLNLPK